MGRRRQEKARKMPHLTIKSLWGEVAHYFAHKGKHNQTKKQMFAKTKTIQRPTKNKSISYLRRRCQGDFAIHLKSHFSDLIAAGPSDIIQRSNNCELYFEEDDLESLLARLKTIDSIEYLHEIKEQPWGQRVIRFYDPDMHIIEVGESLESVARRFLRQGLSIAETARWISMPEKNCPPVPRPKFPIVPYLHCPGRLLVGSSTSQRSCGSVKVGIRRCAFYEKNSSTHACSFLYVGTCTRLARRDMPGTDGRQC